MSVLLWDKVRAGKYRAVDSNRLWCVDRVDTRWRARYSGGPYITFKTMSEAKDECQRQSRASVKVSGVAYIPQEDARVLTGRYRNINNAIADGLAMVAARIRREK